MELYHSFALLIVIATVFSYINNRYLKFPDTIGIMIIALLSSIAIVVIGYHYDLIPLKHFASLIAGIDFSKLLMGGLLNFLLFASAIHINLEDLKDEKLPIIVFSSISVVISTVIVGFALYFISHFLFLYGLLPLEIPLVYALLFGALISPTDPIAVLSILKQAKVAKSLETKIAGESLFNDGVAVVLFSVILNMTLTGDLNHISIDWTDTLILLCKEVFGGILIGLGLGYLAFKAMETSRDLKIAILATLSVVMAGYLIANSLHFSGPLAMVVSGLVIGYKRRTVLKNGDKDYVSVFWELIDQVLNALLFLFIGFEILLIPDLLEYWVFGIIAIFIVLIARYISIKLPIQIIPFKEKFNKDTITVLVWGGLRGAVSIALALSLPNGPYKNLIIGVTYFVVVFSILVQGLSIGKIANKLKVG